MSVGRGEGAGSASGAVAAVDPLGGQFETIGRLLYETAGIALNESKRELVHARLERRLRQLGGGTIPDYVDWVSSHGGREELTEMVDLLTTNKTGFFREMPHFALLEELVSARAQGSGSFKVWSAGCSSGEEAYTIAMILAECGGGPTAGRILATDLSRRMLDRARLAVYDDEQLRPVSPELRGRHLVPTGEAGRFRVSEALRGMIRFGRLNLMGPWPMKGPFDVIFCRNVMIYFDAPTRERLVERFTELLTPGGYLFVGHSESLSTLDHALEYVRPATYRRS